MAVLQKVSLQRLSTTKGIRTKGIVIKGIHCEGYQQQMVSTTYHLAYLAAALSPPACLVTVLGPLASLEA